VSTTLHQAGAIAYRVDHGQILVLLITSRDTGRWIIPKGNINALTPPSKAAEIEAYEEAGVKGTIEGSIPLGFYTYFKKYGSGEQSPTSVEVYLLRVRKQVKKWPEKRERKLSWVSITEAIELIEEPGVVPLLRRFSELIETDLISADPKDTT
jgi:8-oxo-dGTP pyrophosphatase MutT (NUDIX family)